MILPATGQTLQHGGVESQVIRLTLFPMPPAETGNAERFLIAASDCWDRRLFVTRKGYLGLGPEALREGDLVCILSGGPVPYILRKRENHYYLVGESYVYSMMGHEAVQQWQEGKLLLKDFELI